MPDAIFFDRESLDGHLNLDALNPFLDAFDPDFCLDGFELLLDGQLDQDQLMYSVHGGRVTGWD